MNTAPSALDRSDAGIRGSLATLSTLLRTFNVGCATGLGFGGMISRPIYSPFSGLRPRNLRIAFLMRGSVTVCILRQCQRKLYVRRQTFTSSNRSSFDRLRYKSINRFSDKRPFLLAFKVFAAKVANSFSIAAYKCVTINVC